MATSAKVSMRVPDGLLARGATIAAKRGHGKLTPVMVEAICHGLGEIERQMGIVPAAASSLAGETATGSALVTRRPAVVARPAKKGRAA